MGSCGLACSGVILFLITTITLGMVTIVFVAAIVHIKVHNFDSLSFGFFMALIGCAIGSFLLLCFGIFASCCGKRLSKTIASFLYFLFAILIIGLGAVVLIKGDALVKYAAKIWEDDQFKEVKEDFEDSFDCCGFNLTLPLDYMIVCLKPISEGKDICEHKIKQFIDKNKQIFAYVTFGLGGGLIVVIFIALCCAHIPHKSDNGILYTPIY